MPEGFDPTQGQLPRGVEAEIKAVTPEYAQELLENNLNRPLRARWVNAMADDMKSGNFKFTNAAIAVDENGYLIDGQHRLHAVVNSGVTVPMVVVRGVTQEAWSKIDRGLRRTTGDEFARSGHTNAVQLAACARILYRYLNDDWGKGSPGDDVLIRLYEEEHPELMGYMPEARRMAKATNITAPVAAVGLYLSSRVDLAGSGRKHDEWVEQVVDGIGLAPDSPARRLRDQLNRNPHRNSQRARLALYARAWVRWARGESVKQLKYNDQDPLPNIMNPYSDAPWRGRR